MILRKRSTRIFARLLILTPLLLQSVYGDSPATSPTGDCVTRGFYGGSEIVITTTGRTAGAIDSLTWKGQEFIDSADHGRQLQSASNFDAGSEYSNETFNPTEAGTFGWSTG